MTRNRVALTGGKITNSDDAVVTFIQDGLANEASIARYLDGDKGAFSDSNNTVTLTLD